MDIALCKMSRLVRNLRLVDARGRKYLATVECPRFLEAASIRIRTLKRRALVRVRRPGGRAPFRSLSRHHS